MATALASSSEAPAARSRAAPMRVRRSAGTIGMGFPVPARAKGGSCLLPLASVVLSPAHGLKAMVGGQVAGDRNREAAPPPSRQQGFHYAELACAGLPGKS